MKSLIIVADSMDEGKEIATYCLFIAKTQMTKYAKHCKLDNADINQIAEFFRCHFRQHSGGELTVCIADVIELPHSIDLGQKFPFIVDGRTVMCRLVEEVPPLNYGIRMSFSERMLSY